MASTDAPSSRSRSRRAAAAIPALLILATLPARPAEETAPAIGALEKEIAAIEAEMAMIRIEGDELSREMQTLAAEEGIARRRLAIARADKERLTGLVAEQEETHEEIQASLALSRHGAEEALREIYKQGRMSEYRSILAVSRPADLLRGVQHLDAMARRQREAVESYLSQRSESETIARDLLARRAALDVAITREESAADGYAGQRRRRQELLDRLDEDTAMHQRAVEELQRAAEQLTRALEALPSGLPLPEIATDFGLLKGSLPWPAPGPVKVTFGRIRNRRFGTVTPHPGLDLEAPPGAAVTAIAAGRVVFSRRHGAYGRTVVIDHGARYLSVYAKLAAASAEEGDSVLPGQEIGFAAEGNEQGKSIIYFEIRQRGKPLDPEAWLRRARRDPAD